MNAARNNLIETARKAFELPAKELRPGMRVNTPHGRGTVLKVYNDLQPPQVDVAVRVRIWRDLCGKKTFRTPQSKVTL